MLVAFTEEVCPVIDALCQSKKVLFSDVDGALDSIASYEEEKSFDFDYIQTKFGVASMVSSWKTTLMGINISMKKLIKKMREGSDQFAKCLERLTTEVGKSLFVEKERTPSPSSLKAQFIKLKDEWTRLQPEINKEAIR